MIMKANNHHLCALLAGSSTIAAESGKPAMEGIVKLELK
jgi:hypothetical protein